MEKNKVHIKIATGPVAVREFAIDGEEWMDPNTGKSRSRHDTANSSEHSQKTLYYRKLMAAAFRKGIFTRHSVDLPHGRFDYFVHERSDKIIKMDEMTRMVNSYAQDKRQAKLRLPPPRATSRAMADEPDPECEASECTASATCHISPFEAR